MRIPKVEIDTLVRSRRRSIGLQISHDGKLTVRAPHHIPENELHSILAKKGGWIQKKKELALRRNGERIPRQFKSGERFYFLGKKIPLFVLPGTKGVNLEGARLFCGPETENKELLLRQWYLKQAKIVFLERCDYYAALMGVSTPTISIGGAKTRWGSCSPTGKLRFCFRLVMAPLSVIDCVVVHELVHLKIRNHSAAFYKEMGNWFPQYGKIDLWLRKNSHLLDLSVVPQRELDRI